MIVDQKYPKKRLKINKILWYAVSMKNLFWPWWLPFILPIIVPLCSRAEVPQDEVFSQAILAEEVQEAYPNELAIGNVFSPQAASTHQNMTFLVEQETSNLIAFTTASAPSGWGTVAWNRSVTGQTGTGSALPAPSNDIMLLSDTRVAYRSAQSKRVKNIWIGAVEYSVNWLARNAKLGTTDVIYSTISPALPSAGGWKDVKFEFTDGTFDPATSSSKRNATLGKAGFLAFLDLEEFTPNQTNIYPSVREVIKAGANITVTPDEAGKTLTIATDVSSEDTRFISLDTTPTNLSSYAHGQVLRINTPAPGRWVEVGGADSGERHLFRMAGVADPKNANNWGFSSTGDVYGSLSTWDGGQPLAGSDLPITRLEFRDNGSADADATLLIKKSAVSYADAPANLYARFYQAGVNPVIVNSVQFARQADNAQHDYVTYLVPSSETGDSEGVWTSRQYVTGVGFFTAVPTQGDETTNAFNFHALKSVTEIDAPVTSLAASGVTVSTSTFDKNLNTRDDNVQKALEKIDDIATKTNDDQEILNQFTLNKVIENPSFQRSLSITGERTYYYIGVALIGKYLYRDFSSISSNQGSRINLETGAEEITPNLNISSYRYIVSWASNPDNDLLIMPITRQNNPRGSYNITFGYSDNANAASSSIPSIKNPIPNFSYQITSTSHPNNAFYRISGMYVTEDRIYLVVGNSTGNFNTLGDLKIVVWSYTKTPFQVTRLSNEDISLIPLRNTLSPCEGREINSDYVLYVNSTHVYVGSVCSSNKLYAFNKDTKARASASLDITLTGFPVGLQLRNSFSTFNRSIVVNVGGHRNTYESGFFSLWSTGRTATYGFPFIGSPLPGQPIVKSIDLDSKVRYGFDDADIDPAKDFKIAAEEETPGSKQNKNLAFVASGSTFTIPTPFPGVLRLTYNNLSTDADTYQRYTAFVDLEGGQPSHIPALLQIGSVNYSFSYLETESGQAVYKTPKVKTSERVTSASTVNSVNIQFEDGSWAGQSGASKALRTLDKSALQGLANAVTAVHSPPPSPTEGQRIEMLNNDTILDGAVITAAEASNTLYTGWEDGSVLTDHTELGSLESGKKDLTKWAGLVSFSNARAAGNEANKTMWVFPSGQKPTQIWINGASYTCGATVNANFCQVGSLDGSFIKPGRRYLVNALVGAVKLYPDVTLNQGSKYIWDDVRWIEDFNRESVDARIKALVPQGNRTDATKTGNYFQIDCGADGNAWSGTEAQRTALSTRLPNCPYFTHQ